MKLFVFLFLFLVSLEILHPSYAHLLQSVSGEVPNGNFSYYSLMYPGYVLLELTSLIGDCDIYVSQFVSNPTYEHYSYCLQSSTCGVDVIVIPKSFKRPLAIGIYGHPSCSICSYTLNIYQINEASDESYDFDELSITTNAANNLHTDTVKTTGKEVSEKDSFVWDLLYEILESVIETLFF